MIFCSRGAATMYSTNRRSGSEIVSDAERGAQSLVKRQRGVDSTNCEDFENNLPIGIGIQPFRPFVEAILEPDSLGEPAVGTPRRDGDAPCCGLSAPAA